MAVQPLCGFAELKNGLNVSYQFSLVIKFSACVLHVKLPGHTINAPNIAPNTGNDVQEYATVYRL